MPRMSCWPWPDGITLRVIAVCGMLMVVEQVIHPTHAIPFLPAVGSLPSWLPQTLP